MGYKVFKVFKVGYKVCGILSGTKSIFQGLQGEIQGWTETRLNALLPPPESSNFLHQRCFINESDII